MTDEPQLRLGVNIDHVATVRNARGGVIPILCVRPRLLRKPELMASPPTCVKTGGTFLTILPG